MEEIEKLELYEAEIDDNGDPVCNPINNLIHIHNDILEQVINARSGYTIEQYLEDFMDRLQEFIKISIEYDKGCKGSVYRYIDYIDEYHTGD